MTKYPTNELDLSQENLSFPIVIGKTTRQQIWVPPHHHQFYEISFYIQGSAFDLVNGRLIKASRGTVICKLPHHIHETRLEKGQFYTKFNLMFDLDILLGSDLELGLKRYYYFASANANKQHIFRLDEERTVLMERLFDEMLKEFESSHRFRQSYIRAKLVEILVQISRSEDPIGADELATGAGAAQSPQAGQHGSKLTQVLQHINAHFLTDLSLGGVAKSFSISTPYLSKMIKQLTGMNFTDYVHELRIEMACSLLASSRMSILDVAVESGYSSFKTFSRVFLRKKGITPSAYRKGLNIETKK